jgi:hypothetical protein
MNSFIISHDFKFAWAASVKNGQQLIRHFTLNPPIIPHTGHPFLSLFYGTSPKLCGKTGMK